MLENNLINSFKYLNIKTSALNDDQIIDNINEKEKIKPDFKNQENASKCLETFGVIIYDDDDDVDDNDNLDDKNSTNLISRGPIKQSNNQRPVPYSHSKNITPNDFPTYNNILNLKVNTQLYGYLTPPSSSQLSPPKQGICKTEMNFLPDVFTPESICTNSPESIDYFDYVKDDFHDQLTVSDGFKTLKKDSDNDSGIYTPLSKQSSMNSLKIDILSGIETPEGIENPDVVVNIMNQLESMENKIKFEDDFTTSSYDVSPNTDEKIKDAYIAVAKMKKESLEKLDSDGDSCLIVASAKNKFYLVKALVERLQREVIFLKMINYQNNDGITALYVAVFNNNSRLVEFLIKNNANVNLDYFSKPRDKNNSLMFRLVHYAAERGRVYLKTLRQLLLSNTLKIDYYNSRGETPLICAIEKHNIENNVDSRETIVLLVQSGADILRQNNLSNKPPLQIAIEKRCPEIVELLLQLASVKAVNDLGSGRHFYAENLNETPFNGKTEFQNWSNGICMENFQNMQDYMPLIYSQLDSDANYNYTNDLLNPVWNFSDGIHQQTYFQSNGCWPQNNDNFHPEVNTDHSNNPFLLFNNNFSEEKLPVQIQKFNCTSSANNKPNVDQQSAKKRSILDQMLNFRKNSRADFSLLSCAYDVCASSKCAKSKDVIKLLLSYGANLAPKSKPNAVSQLPEFLVIQRKKKKVPTATLR